MQKILNTMLSVIRFILLLLSLGLTFFIVLSMYNRVGKSIFDSIPIFLPMIILLILFVINITFYHKKVLDSLFYNLTTCLVFSVICFICYRSIFDKNMILNRLMGYNINFSYFSDFIPFMKIMIYGLILGNIFLIISSLKDKYKNADNELIAKKIEVL